MSDSTSVDANITTTNIEEYIRKYVTEDYVNTLSKSDKTFDAFDLVIRLGIIIPLTIVASNHLGNFLPLPITCQAFLKNENLALLVSHCILFFLILFSISGNIKWGEFNEKMENKGFARFFADVAVAIAGWLFLLMFLRLRKLWMYAVLFVSLFLIFFALSVYKNSKKESQNRTKEVNAAISLLSIFAALVVIFFGISFYMFKNTQSQQIKAYKVDNQLYRITQPKESTPKLLFKYLTNPEVSKQDTCVKAKPNQWKSSFGQTSKDIVSNDIELKIKNITNLPEKMQEQVLEIQNLLKNRSVVNVNKQESLSELWGN